MLYEGETYSTESITNYGKKMPYDNPITMESTPVEKENVELSLAQSRRVRDMMGSNPLAQVDAEEGNKYLPSYKDDKKSAVNSYMKSDAMRGIFHD